MSKRKVNILHLIDHYRIGGPGKTILNSAKFIDNNKYKIYVSYFKSRNVESDFSSAIKKQKLPYLELMDSPGIRFHTIFLLMKFIQSNKIRILHTHVYKADIIGIILKYIIPNIILITTHHGWISNNKMQRLYIRVDLLLSRFFNGIIFVSKPLHEYLISKMRKKRPMVIIHNAIVVEDYKKKNFRIMIRNKYGISSKDILLGVIGRLSPEKGCLEFLGVFKELSEIYQNLKLMFIGEGPLFDGLKKQVDIYQLSDKVLLTGYQKVVQPFYETFDIFISPSKTEGISNVILEAMAYRLPIVATDVGGNSEIIKSYYNGILIKLEDYTHFKEVIIELINNKQLRRKISNAGLRTLKQNFSFDMRMKKVQKFYDSLLGDMLHD